MTETPRLRKRDGAFDQSREMSSDVEAHAHARRGERLETLLRLDVIDARDATFVEVVPRFVLNSVVFERLLVSVSPYWR